MTDKNISNEPFLKDAVMYFRNNSTGKPTLIHFMNNNTKKSFCGFDDFGAEVIIIDESDNITEIQCCKKCLKAISGINEHHNRETRLVNKHSII